MAVPIVKVLSLFLVLSALSSFVGIQLLLPMGLDRPFLVIALSAGLLNVALALWALPRWGVLAMPWVAVVAEGWVSLGMLGAWLLLKSRR